MFGSGRLQASSHGSVFPMPRFRDVGSWTSLRDVRVSDTVASYRTLTGINYARSRRSPLAEILIAVSAMLPRQVLPRQFYLITRRCSQRQFLLRPDTVTNNAFLYCLIAAALRCEIDVLLPCAMSNHYLCAAAHK
jgi:hypothetical protein